MPSANAMTSTWRRSTGRDTARGVSLVDRVSFEVMRRLGFTIAFAFDAHFHKFGFRALPN